MGFRRLPTISQDGRFFDIWYRPSVNKHLEYESYGDLWISKVLPLEIGNGTLCASQPVTGRLNISLFFPNPNVAQYAPPFTVTLKNRDTKAVLIEKSVKEYGSANINFELNGINCGNYEVAIDKQFSTDKDKRNLSAQYVSISGVFKFAKQ